MDPVIIYTTPACFYCKIAKEFLRRNGVPFEERDVDANPAYVHELEEKSHQRGVPVIEVGDEIFVGFDRPAVARALGIENG
jgi:glutaredoxin-like YruB-family protein